MRKRVLLMTGSPGVGKTTALLKTIDMLKVKGFIVGGMLSREVRSSGTRVGFEVVDLFTGKMGWLAKANQKYDPQVGKYHVNLADLDGVGTEAIRRANNECDIVVVDEIGPMELFSEKFRHSVKNVLDGRKPVIATIHWRTNDQFVKETKTRQDVEILVVTLENRDILPSTIMSKAMGYLSATILE